MSLIRSLVTRPAYRAADTVERIPIGMASYNLPASGVSEAGPLVSPDTALRVSAAWACVRLLSETVGMLPLQVFQRLPTGGRKVADQHPLYDLLHDAPNASSMTAMAFRQMLQLHVLLRGNGYAQIEPGARGFVDQLLPLHPDQVLPQRNPDWTMLYRVWDPRTQKTTTYQEDQIFHLIGLSLDGVTGVSVLSYARTSLGLALGAEQYASRFFSQDARPVGALKTANKLSESALTRLRESWQAIHGGIDNAGRVAILEEGLEFQQLSFNPEDSQLLGMREFSVADVARWYNVPLHMIQHETKDTSWGSGIEQLGIGFVTWSLLPWLTRWEQTINRRLILAPKVFYAEHELKALVRGDMKTRYESYGIGRQWGFLSANRILELEGENPIGPEGDMYLQPVNMVPLGTAPAPALSPGQPPRGTASAATDERTLQLALIGRQAAERVLRKEAKAMQALERRHADDQGAWKAAVEDFYSEHRRWVSDVLGIPEQQAAHWSDQQRADVLRQGAQLFCNDGQAAMLDDLTSLALARGTNRDPDLGPAGRVGSPNGRTHADG